MKKIAIITLLVSGSLCLAQNKTGNYSKIPYWIEMIKDPNVNYFEAIKAYEEFWKGKEKPTEEDETIGQDKKANDKGSKKESKEKIKEKERYRKYTLDCKKFENWKRQVKPYVQADGRILTREEQLKIWETQKQNRKK